MSLDANTISHGFYSVGIDHIHKLQYVPNQTKTNSINSQTKPNEHDRIKISNLNHRHDQTELNSKPCTCVRFPSLEIKSLPKSFEAEISCLPANSNLLCLPCECETEDNWNWFVLAGKMTIKYHLLPSFKSRRARWEICSIVGDACQLTPIWQVTPTF